MRSFFDFSSWQAALFTLAGLALVSLLAVGVRLLVMQTVQQRRERANRQINERLKTLIAAYKTLGGSFTGDLTVDPSHLRQLRLAELAAAPAATPEAAAAAAAAAATDGPAARTASAGPAGSDRRRRLRDAVEAALSDVVLPKQGPMRPGTGGAGGARGGRGERSGGGGGGGRGG